MFKILSTVYVLIVTVLFSLTTFSFPTMADGETTGGSTPVILGGDNRTSQERRCESVSREWRSAVKEMSTICSSTNVNLRPAENSSNDPFISCVQTIGNCCLNLNSENCDNESSNNLQRNVDQANSFIEELQEQMAGIDSDDPQFNQLQGMEDQVRRYQGLSKLYGQCPMRGAVGITDAYEEAEEAREKVEEREEAIAALQDELNQVQTKLEEDQARLRAEIEKLETDTENDLAQIQEQADEAEKQLIDAIEARQQSIRNMLQQIADLEMGKADAGAALEQRTTELRVGCYEEATQKAQRSRARVIERAARGEYSAESLDSLYKSVGSSTLEDSQKLVEYHRRLCENSFTYKQSVKLAFRAYEQALGVADRSIDRINGEIGRERQALANLQSSDRYELYQDTMKKIERLQKAYERGIRTLNEQYQNATASANRQISSLQQQIAQKQAHLQAAQDHLTYKNSLMDLREQATGGELSIESETWNRAISSYYTLRNLVSAVTASDSCGCSGMGASAKAFADAVGFPSNCEAVNTTGERPTRSSGATGGDGG